MPLYVRKHLRRGTTNFFIDYLVKTCNNLRKEKLDEMRRILRMLGRDLRLERMGELEFVI
jgi:hypothetical protein